MLPILLIADKRPRSQRVIRGARPRRQRLSDPADRPQRAARARAHAGPAQALHRAAARQRAGRRSRWRVTDAPDRPLQPALSRQPSRSACSSRRRARDAALGDDARHRSLQGGQRHPRPRRRRRSAARIRPAASASNVRERRPGLPATAARSSSWSCPIPTSRWLVWSQNASARAGAKDPVIISGRAIAGHRQHGRCLPGRRARHRPKMLKRADAALYQAKRSGRNMVYTEAA